MFQIRNFGIVVVDPDDAEALVMVQKQCPETSAKSITGQGQHWVYRHPRKGPIHNATGIEIDGVEYDICIKGDGGMCTAPGSLHANGSIYQEVAPWTLHLLGSAPVWDDLWLPRPTWENEDWDEEPDAKHEKHISRSDLIPMAERAKLAWERLHQEGGTREGTGEASKKCFRLAVEMLWKYALSQTWAGAILAKWGRRNDQTDGHGLWKPWTEKQIEHKIKDALKQHRDYSPEVIDLSKAEAEVDEIVKPAPVFPSPIAPITNGEAKQESAPKKKTPKPTQAQRLVKLALEKADFFHTPDEVGYATIPMGGHKENWPVRSSRFRRWLTAAYWQWAHDAPNDKAIKSTLEILEHRAMVGECQPTYLRVARAGQKIYIDLGDKDWKVVEVAADGWQIIDNSPVKFRRTKNTGALPMPSNGGSLDDLRPLAATTDENWTLIKGWLLDALKGHGPYMALVVTGEQGSAKSSLCRLLRSLIDPLKIAPLSSLPREEKDLGVDGANEHLLAYDNVSYLPQWLSDCLCRVSTGGGIKSRMLYTDGEQSIFDICRPLCLNGIPDFAESNDLLGRSLIVSQPAIPEDQRLDEKTLDAMFEKMKAGAFGAILDHLCRGLRSLDAVQLPGLPRMADSAKWVTACLGDQSFLIEYQQNAENAIDLGLEASPIAGAIKKLLADGTTGMLPGHWEGTASELLEALDKRVSGPQFSLKTYPRMPGA